MDIKISEIANHTKLDTIIKTLDSKFNSKNMPAFKKALLAKSKINNLTMNQDKMYDFLKSELAEFSKKLKINELLLSPKKLLHSNSFDWIKSLGLTLKDANELRLLKGVAMSSGVKKDGVIESEDNIAFGTGTMSAFTINGTVTNDIDHHKDGIPEDSPDYKNFDIKKINEVYPPSTMLAVGLGRNTVGNDGTEKVQTEFIAVCANEYVYNLVKENKIVGCSTEENMKNMKCEGDSCHAVDSHLHANTFLLAGVPNSDSTWVSIVDKSDIGGILVDEDQGNISNSMHKKLIDQIKQTHLNHVKNDDEIPDITKYYNDDGTWKDGAASIEAFLTVEKNVNVESAKVIADYLFVNPDALNETHLMFFSADDLVSWAANLNFNKIIKQKNQQLLIQRNSIKKLESKSNITQFGQGEVDYNLNYPDGQKCFQCRWFISLTSDPEELSTSMGACAIVAGDISGQGGCNKFEAMPGGTPAPDPDAAAAADDAAAAADTSVVPNLDPILPLDDGTCTDGYTLQDVEGTEMCVPTQATIDAFDAAEAAAAEAGNSDETLTTEQQNKLLNKKNKVKSTTLNESDPQSTHNQQMIDINKEIAELKKQLNKIPQRPGMDSEAKRLIEQRNDIKKQITSLQQKKRAL